MKIVPPSCEAFTNVGCEEGEALLRELARTASGPYLRPFTPSVSWHSAKVFIVGTNPATPMRDEFKSFEDYWHALTHDPALFEAVYMTKRSGKPSNTAIRIKHFEAALGDMELLRTNACALPSGRWSELPAGVRRAQLADGLRILRVLVEICRPTAILAHGKEGVSAISALFGVPLDPYAALLSQSVDGFIATNVGPVQLFAYPHLSGIGVKKGFAVGHMCNELEALGRKLKATSLAKQQARAPGR